MAKVYSEHDILQNEERIVQLKSMLALGSNFYALPLYLFFCFADYYYYPDYFSEFTVYRVATALALVGINFFAQKTTKLRSMQLFTSAALFACSLPINFMIYRVHDAGSPYFIGLILVIVGLANSYRFTNRFYFVNLAVTTIPYLIVTPWITKQFSSNQYLLNSMFLVSTVLIACISRVFHERLYAQEFLARQSLNSEIEQRNDIIKKKTQEAVELSLLSKQFSPQVVQAIKEGTLNYKQPVHRAEICVIFIDIVGSTDRFTRLDREDLNKIISMYMDDTMNTLLKYDITIDKFLGDGVLGFSNDPIQHDDYIERILYASIEILSRIQSKQKTYDELWLTDFKVRLGVSAGYASVGFYGNKFTFRSYTGIGRPINLAARLGSVANLNEVLVSQDVVNKLRDKYGEGGGPFTFTQAPFHKLKGFESDVIKLYSLVGMKNKHEGSQRESDFCPHGHGVLYLDTNDKGHYVFKCRHCDFILSEGSSEDQNKKKIA